MSSNNFLPFPMEENAHIQGRLIQRQRSQGLGISITTPDPFANQNPYHSMLSAPSFHGSLNRNRLLSVRRNDSMIHKFHQVHAGMRMARRFGIGAQRAARAPFLRNRGLMITRQIPVINHQVVAATFTCFQDYSTSNLPEGSGVEIHGHEDDKLVDIEEQEDGLDLRLKL